MVGAHHSHLVTTGNAIKDGKRGWFVGEFIPASLGLAHQEALEIKWGQHPKGQEKQGFAKSLSATTIAILVQGAFVTRLRLAEGIREIVLTSPGDYLAFGAGIDHSWQALEDSLVITIRFPSLGSDSRN